MRLNDLVKRAAEHAVRSIEDASSPLVPFTMQLHPDADPRNSQLLLARHAAETLEESLQNAQDSVTPNPVASMYAIAWDGFITLEGRKWDAILIEAGESQLEDGAIFAQPYELRKKGLFGKMRNVAVGELVQAGPCKSRLWHS